MGVYAGFKIKAMSPQLLVTDIERSIEYYASILGFDLDFIHEDFYASVSKERYSIHLKLVDSLPRKQSDQPHERNLDVVFSVEGIDELYGELSGKPSGISQPLRQMPYGKEFYLSDPDGNVLGFIE